ncbi:MAG TPA: FixH family protein [Kofleriaceae bacterium]|nr:FixH family protein [Kofleriaceae bacterium]
MRSYLMRMVLAASVTLLAACPGNGDDGSGSDTVDCTMVTGADTFVVGLEKPGMNGALDFKMMSATPAPPARGDNTWIFQINEMASGVVGNPVDGLSLMVTPFMPAHQHGSPIQVQITPTGDAGQYKLDPVNLWMPGVWETTIRATTSAQTSDTVVYRFCIP